MHQSLRYLWSIRKCEGVIMGVVCGEVSEWGGMLLANTSSIRLGWEIE